MVTREFLRNQRYGPVPCYTRRLKVIRYKGEAILTTKYFSALKSIALELFYKFNSERRKYLVITNLDRKSFECFLE